MSTLTLVGRAAWFLVRSLGTVILIPLVLPLLLIPEVAHNFADYLQSLSEEAGRISAECLRLAEKLKSEKDNPK